jgi:Fic family protein
MKYITIKEASAKWGITERSVRRYCVEGQVTGAIMVNKHFKIPADAEKPNKKNVEKIRKHKELNSLAKRVIYEEGKNNHFGIYEYIQLNLTYSSNRMASNRLTLGQVMELFRTNKISPAFEPMKVDDLIETINHFACVRMVIEKMTEPLTSEFIKKLHHALYYGTYADRKKAVIKGEYRKNHHKFGIHYTKIHDVLEELIYEYEQNESPTMEDILDFHVRFEKIRPFEDGNGRVGRIIMMKECLRHGIDPFIVDDKNHTPYNKGIANWPHDKTILMDTCLRAQSRFSRKKELCKLMEYCKEIPM